MVPENRDQFEVCFRKGVELARIGRWEEAGNAYREAISLNPTDAQTHLNLGFVYYELGYDAQAQESFEQARRLQACCGK